jgi:hypothetical protein
MHDQSSEIVHRRNARPSIDLHVAKAMESKFGLPRGEHFVSKDDSIGALGASQWASCDFAVFKNLGVHQSQLRADREMERGVDAQTADQVLVKV